MTVTGWCNWYLIYQNSEKNKLEGNEKERVVGKGGGGRHHYVNTSPSRWWISR